MTTDHRHDAQVAAYGLCRTCEALPPAPPVDHNVTPVGHAHPATSTAAASRALPRSGTRRRQVYDLIGSRGSDGMTDKEIEASTGGSHEAVSACRNSLAGDGLVIDSGLRRLTPAGNPSTVWVTRLYARPPDPPTNEPLF